jgi:Zn-dependent peptidase ImmA (M78 family)
MATAKGHLRTSMVKKSASPDEPTSIEELIVNHRDTVGGDPLLAYQASLPSVVLLQKEGVTDSDIEGAFGIHLQDAHRTSLSSSAGSLTITLHWLEPPIDMTSGRALDGRIVISVDERILYAPGWPIAGAKFLTKLSSVIRQLTYGDHELSDAIRLDEGFEDRSSQRVLLSDIGNMAWLRYGALHALLPVRDVVGALTVLGSAIAERIQWARSRGYTTEHLEKAFSSWHSRLSMTGDERLAAITKISPTRKIFADLRRETASLPLTADDWQRRPSLILETARLSCRFDDPQIRALITRIRKKAVSRSEAKVELRQDADAAKGTLSEWASSRPFQNGYALAQWFRKRLHERGIIRNEWAPLDLGVILQRWGVMLVSEPIAEVPEIDAFAIWEDGRTPIIVLNEVGIHNEGEGGRRATIAHEICHLLVDRGSTLPVVEIKGGDLFPPIEQRANAFAAELLVPQAAVVQLAKTIKDDEILLKTIIERFRVSYALAKNQMNNARQRD